ITKLTRDGTTLVLSCEGWGHSGRKFNRLDLLERLGLRPEVVYFVRPPLDWLNAAWWQWGAWTGLSFEEWLEEQGSRGIAWDTHAANWQRLAAVRHLHLRVMTADVVRSFGQILGCTWSSPDHTNTGSPELLLRYLQEDRSLRPGEHNSIIEFILNRWVDWPERRAPWIIPRHLQEEIMSTYSPHAERLLALASPESRPSIEEDERWWSAEPYEQRDIDDDIRQLTPDERDVLIRALIDGIANLDRKYRQLDSSGG
ncbi:MAG: hypothetical protein HKN94_11800, partial [Acidimicrobiales bacterium]|nr:hypothetical protein [Acidimicrobiales bacterium]